MTLRRYKITGRGSFTRWETADGRPVPFGQDTPADARLVFHDAEVNSDIIMLETTAAKHPDAKLIPLLDRDQVAIKSEPAPAAAAEVAPAEETKKAKAHKEPKAKAPKAEG